MQVRLDKVKLVFWALSDLKSLGGGGYSSIDPNLKGMIGDYVRLDKATVTRAVFRMWEDRGPFWREATYNLPTNPIFCWAGAEGKIEKCKFFRLAKSKFWTFFVE